MSAVQVDLEDAVECPKCGHHFGREMSAQQVSKLESLILDKICGLGYVSKVGYSDNGREVTIVAVHDRDPDRDGEMVREIGDGGTEIEDETPNRMIITVAISDGPDLGGGCLDDQTVVYTRETGR